MNLSDALAALERVTGFKPIQSGNEFKAKCPAHDRQQTLKSVEEGEFDE